MPTVAEYFFADVRDITTDKAITVHHGDEDIGQVTARCHLAFDSGVRYASFLIAHSAHPLEIGRYPLKHPELALDQLGVDADLWMPNSTPDVRPIAASELPFSRRMLLYYEDKLIPEQQAALHQQADADDFRLDIRDAAYAEQRSAREKPLAFISHDSRDKDDLVRPLANELRLMLCPVWYDEFSLIAGSSLRESLDRGLRESSKCIVILSPNFIDNPGWTIGEFNAIVGRHFKEGRNILLPVWHGVSAADVANYSPMVADIYALNSSMGIEPLATELLRLVKFGAS